MIRVHTAELIRVAAVAGLLAQAEGTKEPAAANSAHKLPEHDGAGR